MQGTGLKGIILAGGSGTRLYPITKSVVKQLLPVYDKPMIYYPLSILMLAGIREILIISTPNDLHRFEALFGSGENLGLKLSYAAQQEPKGLTEAFIIGEEFIGDDSVCLILGDNLLYGDGLYKILHTSKAKLHDSNNALIFGYYVNNPSDYGVVGFDAQNNVTSIEEKPSNPKSNYAVIGLYFYPNDVISKAKTITPSHRGELEITSINQVYLQEGRLNVELLGRGYAWLDTGTHTSLLEASNFIEIIEKRQGLKVACLEEIAYKMGYISQAQLLALAHSMAKNQYGQYLLKIANL